MSLEALAKSISKQEVLIPRLRNFLAEESDMIKAEKIRRKQVVIRDAKMTIKCFRDRIEDYNHGEFKGELFHPSQLGTCQRKLWYHHNHAPKDVQSSTDLVREWLIFETGTYIGVMIQNLCQRAGLLTRREVAIVDHRNKILGHADGEIKIGKVYYVLELKTINSRGFTKLSEPQKSHVKQAHAYMKSLKHEFAIILYIEKDRHALKEFVVPFSAKFYEEHVAQRIKKHFRNLKRNTPPEREGENPRLMPCTFCCFKRVCFGTHEGAAFMKGLKNGS